ncbi:PAS domain S-box-containing protein [Nocardioides sp. HB32]
MSEMESLSSSSPDELAYLRGLGDQLRQLESRLDRARSSSDPELVADLETAYEELRVADEEVRTQQETIARLVRSTQDLRLRQEQALATLPVPILVTDMHGVIRSASAAAAQLAGAPLARLLGKPVFALIALDDRPALRRLVSDLGRGGAPIRYAATLVPRTGEPVGVELIASAQVPGAGTEEISWLLLQPGPRSDRLDGSLTGALTELALLPWRGGDRARVLSAAADICARLTAAEVTIALGPPAEPAAVASASAVAQECDGVQVAAGTGPAVTAHEERATVTSPSVGDDDRWPALHGLWPSSAPAATVTSIETGGKVLGTLAAYGHPEPGVPVEMLEVLAVALGGVLHEVELVEEVERLELDMQQALSSRAVIDQAKGVLMAARGMDADQAWAHLVAISSSEQRKVRDVARDIVARVTGTS